MKKIFFLALVAFASCKPFDNPEQPDNMVDVADKTIDQLEIPNGFTFNTTTKTHITLKAQDNSGKVLAQIPFEIFIQQNTADSAFLLSGRTDTEGVFETDLELSPEVKYIIANTSYIGLPSTQKVAVKSDRLNLIIGEDNDMTKPRLFVDTPPSGLSTRGVEVAAYTYMGKYDAKGVPKYLLRKGDVVSQDILNIVNASLPEGSSLSKSHPEYLASTVKSNIRLIERAAVWVTFVHEGAGYRNALGYYTYPTNKPPTTVDDIQKLNVIFPNASFHGSGGGLRTGDKVLLDTFDAGTTVAWFVVPDGWNPSTQKVSNTLYNRHYSDKNLNTFTSEAYRNHVVTLVDPSRELFLVGFEDLDRPGGDQDFNDAVFYATVSSFRAVQTTGMAQTTDYAKDTDGDGVPDSKDFAPEDPNVAFNSHFPAINQDGTLAFEDMFPKKGDYDMNDLVTDYHIEEWMNAANKITKLKVKLNLRATGAGYRNGFGIELPIAAGKIQDVQGCKIKDTYIKRNANGTEAGQSKAVIIAFDNGYTLLSAPDGGFVNTEKEKIKIPSYLFEFIVNLKTPVTRAELGNAPYNPFIIVNRERGREVHLAGKTPTALADLSLFQTGDDDTGTGQRYYQTKRKLPWAINLPTSFKYPIEKMPINKAYLKFNVWAESGGHAFSDWFSNATGYRVPEKLY